MKKYTALWTKDYETSVIEALRDDRKGVKRPGSYYSIKEKYEITAIAGVTIRLVINIKLQFFQLKLTIT